MRQGDIFFTDLEPTKGREQRGRRPVLIVSPDELNALTHAPIVLPITNGGAFAIRFGLAVSLPSSLHTTGVVRCDQPRTMDLSERGARYVETAPQDFMTLVLKRFVSLFDPDPEL